MQFVTAVPVMVVSSSRALTVAAVAVFAANGAFLAVKQSRHLGRLGFSHAWIGKLNRISLLAVLSALIALGTIVHDLHD